MTFALTRTRDYPADVGLDTMRLQDGRTLEYYLAGPTDAADLLVLHLGTPSAAVDFPLATEAAAARGIRTVTYSRPGYANSTREPGRTIADAAQHTAALADHLGAERFLVAGWSGGGAPALACAALLPERVRGCVVLAGLAPPEEVEEDWLAWHRPADREEIRALLSSTPDELIPEYKRAAEEMAAMTPQALEAGDPEADLESNRRYPAGPEAIAESMRRAVSTGIWGWLDDEEAWVHPWGFRVGEIRVPVTIRHGTADPAVPIEHGRWLAAHILGARAQILEGYGHGSIAQPFEPVIDVLLETAR